MTLPKTGDKIMSEAGTLTQEAPKAAQPTSRKIFMPRADVYETREAIVVLADMPGVDEAGVDITLEKNVLTLRGKVADAKFPEQKLAWAEYAVGDYERTFTIGTDIQSDAISATVKNGVLKVTLPKSQPVQARKISVRAE